MKLLRTSTINYIRDILKDYTKTDLYIKKREEELRYPHKDSDDNAGIKGNGTSNPTERMMITISEDRRLSNLERNRNVIDNCLNLSDDTTKRIINELYLKTNPTLTLTGLAEKLHISKNTAYRLRNSFFESIAEELGI